VDSGSFYYYIYRDGTYIGHVASPTLTYADTGLAVHSSHNYVIYALDRVTGLNSGWSNVAPATTQGTTDNAVWLDESGRDHRRDHRWQDLLGQIRVRGYVVAPDPMTR
jgi:hypothetical protein